MTLVGRNHFPSQAYVSLIARRRGTVRVKIAAAGVGPQDGFTEYPLRRRRPPAVG